MIKVDENRLASNIASKVRGSITLEMAKLLMDEIEEYARKKGMACVIAVGDAHGNPIAVHVMENAFLVSFDVATRKAYTAVAVKMSTTELSKLVQPGGTFYGLDAMAGGKIVAFGGGVPLKIGNTIVGGLGISGGTGEEDDDIARQGLRIFDRLTGQ